ncbi:MAG: holin family protein [Rhodobacterales bacterium]|nr:holin family protein [Rhodobacterales bacterium]
MGLIGRMLATMFGGNRNLVAQTVEVFRENAEAGAIRQSTLSSAAMAEFASEFAYERKGWFDRFVDGLNRLPRPAMALGTMGLFLAAMVDPIWFSTRMQGIALVPEPLWWLLGVIVSFYFGARFQLKDQNFQRTILQTAAQAPEIVAGIEALERAHPGRAHVADTGSDADATLSATKPEPNPALQEWRGRNR